MSLNVLIKTSHVLLDKIIIDQFNRTLIELTLNSNAIIIFMFVYAEKQNATLKFFFTCYLRRKFQIQPN